MKFVDIEGYCLVTATFYVCMIQNEEPLVL